MASCDDSIILPKENSYELPTGDHGAPNRTGCPMVPDMVRFKGLAEGERAGRGAVSLFSVLGSLVSFFSV